MKANYKLLVEPGDYLDHVAVKAQQIAIDKNVKVEFELNKIKCVVDSETNLKELHKEYRRKYKLKYCFGATEN